MDEFEFKANDAHAFGFPTGKGKEFVVRAGSTALVRSSGADRDGKLPQIVDELKKEGVLSMHPTKADLMVFAKDHHFSSATAAGDVVNGANVSAPSKWLHRQTGQSLKDWLQAK